MSKIPLTDEYIEAEKHVIDKKREAYIKTLSQDEQEKLKKVEELAQALVDLKCPFFLSIAPINDQQVWRYYKTTSEKFPASKAEGKRMYTRAFALLRCQAMTFANTNGQVISMSNPDGKTVWSVGPEGEKY